MWRSTPAVFMASAFASMVWASTRFTKSGMVWCDIVDEFVSRQGRGIPRLRVPFSQQNPFTFRPRLRKLADSGAYFLFALGAS